MKFNVLLGEEMAEALDVSLDLVLEANNITLTITKTDTGEVGYVELGDLSDRTNKILREQYRNGRGPVKAILFVRQVTGWDLNRARRFVADQKDWRGLS